MMRFKKGDKVEVMNQKEFPVSWRTAIILSANGHTYCLQYDSYHGVEGGPVVGMASRKFVRPCPPLVHGVESCVVGDVLEVFYEYSWKIAAIMKIMEGRKEKKSSKIYLQASTFQNQYLVRLLGCSKEIIVDRSSIRMRQTWLDNKWIVMGKSSGAYNDAIASIPSTSNLCQKMNFNSTQLNARNKNQSKRDRTTIQDDAAFRESAVISSKSMKRMSPYSSSIVDAQNGHVQKYRAIEKGCRTRLVVATRAPEKVDAVAYPREILGENNMHPSFNIIPNGYNQMNYSGVRSSELNSSDSDACSVGSCSITSQSQKNNDGHIIPLHFQEMDTLCSDAESSCCSSTERKSHSVPLKEEVEVSIRMLELCAYRRTLEALYASGPLSWDQEALLTNLRIMLHISNDEHLKELKHLISSKTAISVR